MFQLIVKSKIKSNFTPNGFCGLNYNEKQTTKGINLNKVIKLLYFISNFPKLSQTQHYQQKSAIVIKISSILIRKEIRNH